MKFLNKKIISISPSDLNNFVACKYIIKNNIKFHNKEIKKNEEKINTKLWREMRLMNNFCKLLNYKIKFVN